MNKPHIDAVELTDKHCRFSSKGEYFALDYSEIAPGTIILTSSQNLPINIFQQRILPHCHKRIWMWSHVAIMGADGHVWDLMPSIDVRRLPFETFISNSYYVAARRFKHVPIDPDILRRKIAEQSHASYAHFTPQFLNAILRSFAHRDTAELKLNRGELLCSSYVDRILGNTIDRDPLDDLVVGYPLPAHFALSDNFSDVLLRNKFFRLRS